MTLRSALLIGAILGVAALLGVAFWQGYRWGHAASEAHKNAELLAQIEAGQELEVERRRVAQERDELARQLEREAHADPVIVDQCFGPNRVRRLNALGQ